MERKLTTLLSADVKEYSRLVAEDDEATVIMLNDYRDMMQGIIAEHRGRVVDSPGDNLLAEFASVIDAVKGACALQAALRERNASQPRNRQMRFRMGVNLGDVVVQGDSLYGDGVNIAARLESLAEADGICISESVYEQVENKLSLPFEFVGEVALKNLPKPVRVWRILQNDGATQVPDNNATADAASTHNTTGRSAASLARLGGGLLLALGLIAGVVWFVSSQDSNSPGVEYETDKPSIVVLPFVNMSNDPNQEYFSDGISQDLTTDLGKLDSLFVISRHSAFSYKGKEIRLAELTRDLSVRYVLEGSVRKMGDNVRISAQLVDAKLDQHIWGDHYDRPLNGLFEIQDEIRQKILAALQVKLTGEQQGRLKLGRTDNLEAYDLVLRGRGLLDDARAQLDPNQLVNARALFEAASELDKDYAAPTHGLAITYWVEWFYKWGADPGIALDRAAEYFEYAYARDPSDLGALGDLGYVHLWRDEHDKAVAFAEQAMAQNPSSETAIWAIGNILVYCGRPQEGLEYLRRAVRLNPIQPPYYAWSLGNAYYLTQQREKAIEILNAASLQHPNFLGNRLMLAIIFALSDQLDEAREQADEIRRISPDFGAVDIRARTPFLDETQSKTYVDALRRAGLK